MRDDDYERWAITLLAMIVGAAIVIALTAAGRARAEHAARCVRPAASVLPADPRCGGGR